MNELLRVVGESQVEVASRLPLVDLLHRVVDLKPSCHSLAESGRSYALVEGADFGGIGLRLHKLTHLLLEWVFDLYVDVIAGSLLWISPFHAAIENGMWNEGGRRTK